MISEIETGDLRPLEEWGHDAQWADELHHELHVLLTGERDGYYADYGSLAALAAQLEREPAERLVVCAQNHDQVGNRALGDRLQPDALRVAAAVTLFSPRTPLLFMGEEYGEPRAVPVLHRPHRPGDRRRHARGAQARVRRLRGVLRRTGARPAGARDLPALEARTAGGPTSTCAPSTETLRRCGAELPRELETRGGRGGGRSCSAAGPASSSPTSTSGRPRCDVAREGLAGQAVPARCDLGRRGDELLALLRERRARRALPVRRRRPRDERIAARRPHRASTGTATSPGVGPGPALRLPRPRALRRRRADTASTRASC